MFCTKCGNQIKDGFKFCPKCGAPAYVEKDTPQDEIKKDVIDDVANEAKPSLDNETVSTTEVKGAKKTETVSKPKKSKSDSKLHGNSILYPLIVKELDVKGVKKMAEQGDKGAMQRQAFRYEMGIGGDINKEKTEKLYSQVGGINSIPDLEEILRPTIIPSDH